MMAIDSSDLPNCVMNRHRTDDRFLRFLKLPKILDVIEKLVDEPALVRAFLEVVDQMPGTREPDEIYEHADPDPDTVADDCSVEERLCHLVRCRSS